MRTRLGLTLFILLIAPARVFADIACQTIWQSTIKGPEGTLLVADIPREGRFIGPAYFIRWAQGGAWTGCGDGTGTTDVCATVQWPPLAVSAQVQRIDVNQYYGTARPISNGDKFVFTGQREVRLATLY